MSSRPGLAPSIVPIRNGSNEKIVWIGRQRRRHPTWAMVALSFSVGAWAGALGALFARFLLGLVM